MISNHAGSYCVRGFQKKKKNQAGVGSSGQVTARLLLDTLSPVATQQAIFWHRFQISQVLKQKNTLGGAAFVPTIADRWRFSSSLRNLKSKCLQGVLSMVKRHSRGCWTNRPLVFRRQYDTRRSLIFIYFSASGLKPVLFEYQNEGTTTVCLFDFYFLSPSNWTVPGYKKNVKHVWCQ